MAPFGVQWISANEILPISPHQTKSKRNYEYIPRAAVKSSQGKEWKTNMQHRK
jgi:hypothetical protein